MTAGISIFKGVQTALATPMRDGEVAWDDLERLVLSQMEEGVDGLVAVGTTGESPTLNHDEHIGVIRRVGELAKGRTPVIAGTGSNSTTEALELSQEAEKAGADALLLVAPYYNKPNQEGLFLHFSAIAEATELPIILYSIPSRCGIEIGVDTVARLYEKYPQICGMKEAGGSCDRVTELVQKLGSDFAVMSGDDALTPPFMSFGATGVISVASNLYVSPLREMVSAANTNPARAREIFEKFAPLFSTLFVEPNPVPVKFALAEKGMISSPEVRLPLAPISKPTQDLIRKVLADLD
ncbi:4-hydroxy-tetrahydrodipicolinate synthase [Puniceicoccus vermicola]|uniref:4-hydroxy-tetrahydrodipicolinate synthase n=1 Tax=Puniceicoccus vermicola TaxID=388746 RepID=A0A7X1AYL2_9BACT|nr:4-hydroxy-tetrahydrodipicolinate synthase [Puniceicoccus vermicola]MBC2602380.1 4-hydroxy-tetrahydrodipicolinate synthase [Puniceicoccus vermicola]